MSFTPLVFEITLVNAIGNGSNTAVKLCAISTVTVSGFCIELTAPVQYENLYPLSGTAVSVTCVPRSYDPPPETCPPCSAVAVIDTICRARCSSVYTSPATMILPVRVLPVLFSV